jgi:hypothetical protein
MGLPCTSERRIRDSNPCYRRERAASWASRRMRPAAERVADLESGPCGRGWSSSRATPSRSSCSSSSAVSAPPDAQSRPGVAARRSVGSTGAAPLRRATPAPVWAAAPASGRGDLERPLDPRGSVERISTRPVAAGPTGERVSEPISSVECVGTGHPSHDVAPGTSHEEVCARFPEQPVAAPAAVDAVVSATGLDAVSASARVDEIRAVAPVDVIVAAEGANDVPARSSDEDIGS